MALLWRGAEGEFPGNCSVSYLSLAMVVMEESVGGASWREKLSSLEGKHAPSISIMTLWLRRLSPFASIVGGAH